MASLEELRNFVNSNNYVETKKDLIISVYAICKDELTNVEEWVEQFNCCDHICILDTGSTDGTYEKLLEMSKTNSKLIVYRKIYEEFHFDEARNDNFKLVPSDTDICLTLDFDERLESNWLDKLLSIDEEILISSLIYIKRNIFFDNKFVNTFDERPFAHSYYFMSYMTWSGYIAENFVHKFNSSSISEANNKFKDKCIFNSNIECKHFVPLDISQIIKSFENRVMFIKFFKDSHNKLLKTNNFFDAISILESRLLDLNSFKFVFTNNEIISDHYIEEEINHIIKLINNQQIDILSFRNEDLTFYILDTLSKVKVLKYDNLDLTIKNIVTALKSNSSNSTETEYLFKKYLNMVKES